MKSYPNVNKLKYKKYHRVNKSFLTQLDQKRFFPIYGNFAIQAVESGKLTFKQIEACRKTLRRGFGKLVSMFIRIFTASPVTSKSVASRMGKGKGNLSHRIAPIKKGQILFETNNHSLSILRVNYILSKASTKLPMRVTFFKARY